MDYEKKYNEALKRAKAAIDIAADKDLVKGVASTIFPELRESEDERMMREFNDWLCEEIECRTNDLRDEKDRRTLNMLCYILTKVKDWLEKQKEQKPAEWNDTDMKEARDNLISVCRDWERGEQTTLLPIVAVRARYFLEHLTEPKSAEWTELTWKDIVELEGIINNVHYDFSAGIGQESFGKEVLERFRNKKDDAEVDACEQKPGASWTIQDARPGDILNSVRVQATIIFKGFNPDGKHIDAYCALQKGFFIAQELPWDRDFEPATQVWKDALFDAMAQKGYLWDAENKRLNKAVLKPAEWSEEDNRMIGRVRGIIERYAFTQNAVDVNGELCEKEYVEMDAWLKSLISGKRQTWGKEDEKNLELVTDCVYEFYPDPVMKYKLKDWLKSLRPQPKPEVTDEEIEEMVTRRSRSTGTTKSEMDFYRNGIKDAIKQFGLRPSWKPSEELLDALHTAAHLPEMEFYGGLKDKLRELDKQLKGHRI